MPLWEMKEVKETNAYNLAGTITESGKLWISRMRKGKPESVPQYCPYRNNDEVSQCCDSCPHFGETETSTLENATVISGGKEQKMDKPIMVFSIPICHGKILRFYNLVDLRSKLIATEDQTDK